MLIHLLNNMKASLLCQHIFHGLCTYVLKLSTLKTYYEGVWLYMFGYTKKPPFQNSRYPQLMCIKL